MQVTGQFHSLVALPAGKNPVAHSVGGWVGPRSGLNALEKMKTSWSCRDSNPGPSQPLGY